MGLPVFTLDYWRDGSWYVGRLREVPSVISQGRSLDELKTNIADAYRMIVEDEKTQFVVGRFQSTMVGISIWNVVTSYGTWSRPDAY